MSTTVPGTTPLNIHLEYKGPVPFTPLRSSSGLSGILSPPILINAVIKLLYMQGFLAFNMAGQYFKHLKVNTNPITLGLEKLTRPTKD